MPGNDRKRPIDRRRFLKGVSVASAATLAGVGTLTTGQAGPSVQQDEFDWLLEGVAEVILAPSGPLPSIAETGLVRFVRGRFAEAGQEERLELGLAAVAMETEVLFGTERGYGELTADERHQMVEVIRLAQTRTPAWLAVGIGPAEFYRQLRFHLVDGYYSHPAVHDAIGFAGPAQFVGHPDFAELPEPGDD